MPVHFNEVARSANRNEKPTLEPGAWRSGLKFAPGLERPNANLWATSSEKNAATSETWRGINAERMPHGPYPKGNIKKIAKRESAVFENAAAAAAANAAAANAPAANAAVANAPAANAAVANAPAANSIPIVGSNAWLLAREKNLRKLNGKKGVNNRNTKRRRTGSGRKTRSAK